MPGTRTAPVVTGAVSYRKVRYVMIDANGDKKSNSVLLGAAVTNTQIETFLAETQLRSNASLFEAEISDIYSGSSNKSNALSEVYLPIEDLILYTIKAGVNTSQYVYLPSPIESQVVAGSDTPDVTALSDWFAAILAIATGYSGKSVTFTRHKETNSDNKVIFG